MECTENEFHEILKERLNKYKESLSTPKGCKIRALRGCCNSIFLHILKNRWFLNPILKEGKTFYELFGRDNNILHIGKDDITLDFYTQNIVFTKEIEEDKTLMITYEFFEGSQTFAFTVQIIELVDGVETVYANLHYKSIDSCGNITDCSDSFKKTSEEEIDEYLNVMNMFHNEICSDIQSLGERGNKNNLVAIITKKLSID